jgi:hypothetical protein
LGAIFDGVLVFTIFDRLVFGVEPNEKMSANRFLLYFSRVGRPRNIVPVDTYCLGGTSLFVRLDLEGEGIRETGLMHSLPF